ncbi:MAG: Smr/MutS family protein [Rhodomicrobiaceae bacterium]
MSKKDDHTGLSSEDAALWEKVTRTLSSFGSKAKSKKDKISSKTQPKTASDTEGQDQLTNQEDFAALLSEQQSSKEQKSEITNQVAISEDELKSTSVKQNKKKPTPAPTREDFAALLDDPNAVISTDKSTKSEKNQKTKPFMPPFSPPTNQSQNKKSQPTIESFNQRDARNISSGKQTIDAAIDLHGLTQAQAETALKTFLKRAHLDNKKTVLVITGKGQSRKSHERSFELGAPEPGIIKRSVPNWLDDMPDVVLSYTTSHSRHGGEGALYVRLRRFSKPGQ